ncbi:DoxX family protein [Nocardiopsis sp. FIRDI 009]|uniref:DoxX family protein n=1 Tax=Nocardiopsis sp. FIRDI 009 TaxID=714197 RepID=UPI000E25F00F|nr:DoxX family protein [Nocardiopsis sp. FIRDI 009]
MLSTRSRPRSCRRNLYDVVAALARVGVGWMFVEHGLDMRGRTGEVSAPLPDPGSTIAGALVGALPALLVGLSIAFAVGLLTWLTGPLLATVALVGALAVESGGTDPSPFASWPTTMLVTAVCVLMAVGGGRWSWDHLVLAPATVRPSRSGERSRDAAPEGAPAHRGVPSFSPRRPEHAPPLLYPVGEAALGRPSRL